MDRGGNATTSGTLTNYGGSIDLSSNSSPLPINSNRNFGSRFIQMWIINIWELYRWIFFLLFSIFLYSNYFRTSWIRIIGIVTEIYCFSYFHQMYGYFRWRSLTLFWYILSDSYAFLDQWMYWKRVVYGWWCLRRWNIMIFCI